MISPETRMMGLPYGAEIMIVGLTVRTQSTSVTDGQTELRSQRPCNAERRTVKTPIDRLHYISIINLLCMYVLHQYGDVAEIQSFVGRRH